MLLVEIYSVLPDSMHLPAVSAILNLDLQYSLLRMKLYIITNEG
jgi:hypothetical protein